MKGKYVLLTTEHRGVFFGKLKEESKEHAILTEARCAIYFGTTRGFLELCETGPTDKSRISSQVDEIKLYDITSISSVSDEAAKKWKAS